VLGYRPTRPEKWHIKAFFGGETGMRMWDSVSKVGPAFGKWSLLPPTHLWLNDGPDSQFGLEWCGKYLLKHFDAPKNATYNRKTG
jgi:hypothetical protein